MFSKTKTEKNSVTINGVEHTPATDYVVYQTKDYGRFKRLPGNRIPNTRNLSAIRKSVEKKLLFRCIIVNEFMEIIDGGHFHKIMSETNGNKAYDDREFLYYVICPGYRLEECRKYNQANKTWDGKDFLTSYCETGIESYKSFRDFMEKYEFLDYWITLRMLTGNINTSTKPKSKTKGNQKQDINEDFREGKFEYNQTHFDKSRELAERLNEIVKNGWYDGDRLSRTFMVAFSRMSNQPNFNWSKLKYKLQDTNKSIVDFQKMEYIANQIIEIYNQGEPDNSKIKLLSSVKSKNKIPVNTQNINQSVVTKKAA